MQFFQRICDNDLRVKPCILSCKNFHRFVEKANNEYIRCICTTPKKDIALGQELTISQSTRFRLWQPHGI